MAARVCRVLALALLLTAGAPGARGAVGAGARASAPARPSAVLVTDSRLSRMVALSARGAACLPSTDRAYIRRVVLEAPRYMVREASDSGMDSLMAACARHQYNPDAQAGFIYPGTKWCGPGNSAAGFHDLGPLEAEDSCCRDHDHCPAQLGPGECRGAVCNDTPFTSSHCDCDERFRRCLQTVGSDAAHTVGAIFFNVARVMCFKERMPCPPECQLELQEMAVYREPRSSDRYSAGLGGLFGAFLGGLRGFFLGT